MLDPQIQVPLESPDQGLSDGMSQGLTLGPLAQEGGENAYSSFF